MVFITFSEYSWMSDMLNILHTTHMFTCIWVLFNTCFMSFNNLVIESVRCNATMFIIMDQENLTLHTVNNLF